MDSEVCPLIIEDGPGKMPGKPGRNARMKDVSDSELKKMRSQIRILYLEEEADTRRINTAYLRRTFGEVVAAGRGEEALEILQRYTPHVIVTEVVLRDGNIKDFIPRFKEVLSSVAFVIYTSIPGIAPTKGFKGVILKKPASNESLSYAIDRILFG